MKHVFIVLTLLIVPACLFAQHSLHGHIQNANGAPVPNASVYLAQGPKKTVLRTVLSDSLGRFSMSVPDSFLTARNFLFATYLNHKSDSVTVSGAGQAYALRLDIPETMLREVVVESGAPSVQKLADRFIFVPGKAMSAGATALEVLKFAPMVQYDERSSLFSIINRSGTVVYINNRRSNLPKEMIISTLRSTAAADIRNIEIITNPGSEYSANTAGGVININFKKMFNEGWSGNVIVSSEQSNFNTTVLNGALNYRKNRIGIRVSPFLNNSFNYSTRENGIVRTGKRESISTESYRRYGVIGGGLGLDYDLGKNDLLSFNGFYSTVNGKSNGTGYTVSSAAAETPYNSPVTGKDRYTYNFGNVYFQHLFDSLGKRTLTVNIDYNQYYQGDRNEGWFTASSDQGVPRELGRYRSDMPQRFFNLSQRIDYGVQLGGRSKIAFGVQFSHTRLKNDLEFYDWDGGKFEPDPELTNEYSYRETYFAGYASYTKTFSDRLNGVLGLRAEQIHYSTEKVNAGMKSDTNYLGLFPNLSLAYAINKQSSISLAVSKKISRPNMRQLFPGRTYLNLDYVQENNPFLQPVNIYNVELMYALRNKYFLSAGHTLSRNQFSQFVIPLYEDNTTLLKKTYLNYGNAGNTYFSFYTQLEPVKKYWETNLTANLNYTRYNIRKSQTAFHTTELSNVNYNLTWNNTVYISRKGKWLAFAMMKYNSRTRNIAYERTNGLFATDLGLRKTIGNFSSTLYFADIFFTNGKSRLLYYPNPAYTYNFLEEQYYTRSVSLSVRYAFGNNKLKLNKNKSSANEEIKNRLGK